MVKRNAGVISRSLLLNNRGEKGILYPKPPPLFSGSSHYATSVPQTATDLSSRHPAGRAYKHHLQGSQCHGRRKDLLARRVGEEGNCATEEDRPKSNERQSLDRPRDKVQSEDGRRGQQRRHHNGKIESHLLHRLARVVESSELQVWLTELMEVLEEAFQ